MTYRAIGIMSGSSLDGVDMVCAELVEQSGSWSFEIIAADCLPYSADWKKKLHDAIELDARSYQLLHTEYGHYLGQKVNEFIRQNDLAYKVALVSSHGHTTFHMPGNLMTAQLGDGAAIAAETQLPVVSDLRAMDVAFGGQGAPIVPIGEKLLLKDYSMFLNLGGIANISFNLTDKYIAFDICPANRVLNMVAEELGKEFDMDGAIASTGEVNNDVLTKLSSFPYYKDRYPKSLVKTIQYMRQEGEPKAIHIVVALACTIGIEHVKRNIPSATIWCGDIDDELTAKGYIVPGLGDAGDLAYGVKIQS